MQRIPQSWTTTSCYEKRFPWGSRKEFLHGSERVPVSVWRETMERTIFKLLLKYFLWKATKLLSIRYLLLCKVGSEDVQHGVRTSLTVHMYILTNSKIQELFCHFFREESVSVTALCVSHLYQLPTDIRQWVAQVLYNTSVEKACEARLHFPITLSMNIY